MLRLTSLLPIALLGACGETINVADDVDITWDFAITPFDAFDADLHAPYVRGAAMGIHVTSDDEDRRFRGWTLDSSDPQVFALGAATYADRSFRADGTAVAEGTATITVRDEDHDVVGRAEIEVLVPDRIVLEAHGYLIQGRDDDAAVDEARIIANGTATYHVRYFRGGQELHGNGVLSATAPAGITTEARTSYLFENREWLTVHTTNPGTFTLDLAADGAPVGTRTVEVVPESAVADVVILSESERGAENGDWLVLLAQAYDNIGRRIFGIDYAWTVEGTPQAVQGDLYRYTYKADRPQSISARRGGHSDTVTIHSDGGYVDSSNNIGCNAGGAAGVAMAFGVLGFVVRRRRRG